MFSNVGHNIFNIVNIFPLGLDNNRLAKVVLFFEIQNISLKKNTGGYDFQSGDLQRVSQYLPSPTYDL